MTTLAVAFLSTALADGAGGPPVAFVANPRRNTGCRDANDCAGLSVYCYRPVPTPSRARPNYCSYGNGVGSICRDQSGCGWLGHGTNARKMRCVSDSPLKRRAETDETAFVARPRPPTSMSCRDPWGRKRGREQRRTIGCTADRDCEDGVCGRGNVCVAYCVFDGECSSGTQCIDFLCQEVNFRRIDSQTNVVDHGDGNTAVQLVNPRSNTGCRDANDCRGNSVYCYRRSHGNQCLYGNGIGSICRGQSGCGWLGHGTNARKMRCDFGEPRRAETDNTAQQLARPRPPSSGRCVDPSAGCRDANDCRGDSVYCYRKSHGNQCLYGNGIGSICRDQSGCGWLGHGTNARKMRCDFGEPRRAETDNTAQQIARPRPPSSGRCVDPSRAQ